MYRASQVALVVKNLPANIQDERDVGSIPGLERSPGEGHDNQLQYSCLENSKGTGDWLARPYGVVKTGIQLGINTHARMTGMDSLYLRTM